MSRMTWHPVLREVLMDKTSSEPGSEAILLVLFRELLTAGRTEIDILGNLILT
jgi:hypothetical protein